jgi:regulator of RNase E activity RraA
VFAAGTRPEDAYGQWEIVEWQKKVEIEGVSIYPGDWIFGDIDGCMIIPREHVERVKKLATTRMMNEEKIRRRITAGDDPLTIYQEEGRW